MTSKPAHNKEHIEAMLSPERRRELDPYELLLQLPLDPYHRIADIGCGPGHLAIPMAKLVPHGKIYALDIEDEMLEAMKARVAEAKLSNIEVQKCGESDFPIEDGAMDGIMLAYVAHHNSDKQAFMSAATRLLKNGGWCAVLEWHKKDSDDGPPTEMRVSPEDMIDLATQAGVKLHRRRELNPNQYFLLFTK